MTATPVPPDPLASVEADLSQIDAAPLTEQAEIFERIHRTIARVLEGTVDQAAQPALGAGQGARPGQPVAAAPSSMGERR